MIEFLKANKMFYFNIIFTKIDKFIEKTKKTRRIIQIFHGKIKFKKKSVLY